MVDLTGLNRYSLMHYEKDKADIKIEDLQKIASTLKIKVDAI